MTKLTKLLVIGFVATLIVVCAATPFLTGHSQKKDDIKEKQGLKANDARREVEKSVIGSIFLENLSMKQTAWELQKAHYFPRDEHVPSARISMRFSRDNKIVGINITETDSEKEADRKLVGGIRSYDGGAPFDKFGEKGEIVTNGNGDFMALRFRQGRYFVQISALDQKNAEFFAGIILESLK